MFINNRNISFKAIRTAEYNVYESKNSKEERKKLTIYELEPSDIPVLEGLKRQAEKKQLFPESKIYNSRNDKNNHYEIILEGIKDTINSLKLKDKFKFKTPSVEYLAVVNNNVCGLLTGNMPKLDMKSNRIVYSNRNKSNETEMDWLISWQPKCGGNITGIGTALLAEFFNYCNNLKGINTIYVRSEIPEKSKCPDFYKNFGFIPVQEETIPCEDELRPVELTRFLNSKKIEFDRSPVIPLELSTEQAKDTFIKVSGKLKREDLDYKSVDLTNLVSSTQPNHRNSA